MTVTLGLPWMASLATVSGAAEGLTKLITKLLPQDFNGLRGGEEGEEENGSDTRSVRDEVR